MSDNVAVVASQHEETVSMVHRYLNEHGIPAAKITGKVTRKGERTRLVRQFQKGELKVMCMTTTAGGVAITLDRADTVHILDETWNPDDQEQLEDRIHRLSRVHQVVCYYYRSLETIETYIQEVAGGKAITNREILDLRRNGLRARREAS
jgi:SNF2 family DNA or RNA helicase